MKTLKSIQAESILFYTTNAADYFSKSFSKKMGGTQKITFEDNFIEPIEIDKKEYYTGKGAKYNNDSIHEHLDVFVTKAEFDAKVNYRSSEIFNREKEKSQEKKALKNFCQYHNLNVKNYDGFSSGFVFFKDRNEVEKELNVDLSEFFEASGKTYFFADSKIGLLMFYHNHRQSFGFEIVNEEKRQEFLNDRQNWVNAPYAREVGQTENKNLFVC